MGTKVLGGQLVPHGHPSGAHAPLGQRFPAGHGVIADDPAGQ